MRTYQPVPSSPGKDVQGALVVEGDNPQDVSAQLEHIQEVDTEPLEDSSGSHDSDGHFPLVRRRSALANASYIFRNLLVHGVMAKSRLSMMMVPTMSN